jgi:Transposase DDE domain group 1
LAQNDVNHNNTQKQNRGFMVPKVTANQVREQVYFRLRKDKPLAADFSGGRITGLGGLPLLGELELTTKLVEGASRAVIDRRVGRIKYSMSHLFLQRVLLICAGYEDGIDSNYHRYDPGVLLAMGFPLDGDYVLASQSTISVLETQRMNAPNCYRLARYILDYYISTRKKRPRRIVLDFDGSCFPAHGDQPGTSYRGYYETNMYFPLLVFDQDGWLLTAVLRPGDQGEARITVAILKRIVQRLRQAWPEVEIVLRADAGFMSPEIYSWCEANHVLYLIRLKVAGGGGGLNDVVKQFVRRAEHRFRRRFGKEKFLGEGGQQRRNQFETQLKYLAREERFRELHNHRSRQIREYGAVYHEAGQGKKKWGKERRIIAVCDHTDTGSKKMFLVTNIENEVPQRLYENLYCQRGNAELFIRDLKALKATKLSCSSFSANQFRLLMHALAYLMLHQLRQFLPPSVGRQTMRSMQEKFIRVAAAIKESVRRVSIQWSSHWQWERLLLHLARRLRLVPLAI